MNDSIDIGNVHFPVKVDIVVATLGNCHLERQPTQETQEKDQSFHLAIDY